MTFEMNEILQQARKDILFLQDPSMFSTNCQNFITQLEQLMEEQPNNKKNILSTAADICLDLQSFLINWKLKEYIDEGQITRDMLNKAIEEISSFLGKNDGAE